MSFGDFSIKMEQILHYVIITINTTIFILKPIQHPKSLEGVAILKIEQVFKKYTTSLFSILTL